MYHSCFRWPRLQRFYRHNESYDWLKEFKSRDMVGQQIRRTVESISKRFFTEVVSDSTRDKLSQCAGNIIIFMT